MKKKRSNLEDSLGVFQDVIMSATGILLMFVFILILSVALNKYSSSLGQAEENATLLQAVTERQELLNTIAVEEAKVKSYVAGEVSQLADWVGEAKNQLKMRNEAARREQEKAQKEKTLRVNLDFQFYRGSNKVKNPAVMVLHGNNLDIWGPNQTSPLRQILLMDREGNPPPEWAQMSQQLTRHLRSALTSDSDGIILLITPSSFTTARAHNGLISTIAEISARLGKPFTYALVSNPYTPNF